MTQKEQKPKKNKTERERFPKNQPYNSDITEEDKKVLNNQSAEEEKKGNLRNRKKPIDYTGEDLDIPKGQNNKLDEKKLQPHQSVLKKKPKQSANVKNPTSSAKTIYQGKDAEKYKDPSRKNRK